MDNLNIIDIIILIIFGLSALTGLARGLISEVISLATLIAAFFIASLFANSLAAAFTHSAPVQNVVSQASNTIGMDTGQPISYLAIGISFGLLFGVTVVVGAIVKSLLNVAFQAGMLGIGNRLLGGIFGLARGFIINLVLIFIVQLTSFSETTWWQQSQWVHYFQPAVSWLGGIVNPALSDLKIKLDNTARDLGSTFQGLTR